VCCVLLGVAFGLVLTWAIWPVEYYDTDPVDLRPDLKREYLLLISSSHSVEDDLERTRRRLGWLGFGNDDDASRALVGLAEKYAESAAGAATTRRLSRLAYALGARDSQVLVYVITPTPTVTATPTSTATPTVTMTPSATPLLPTIAPTSTAITKTQVTPEVQATATATPLPPYEVYDKSFSCQTMEHPDAGRGLLKVRVEDADGRPQAGVALSITWADDEDTFFTGLQPGEGPGYADFVMQPGLKYSLSIDRDESDPVAITFRGTDCVSGTVQGLPVWQVLFRGRDDS
jgi:hypothetical protein